MNNLIKISTVENKTKEPIIVNVNQRSENSKQLGKSCVLGEGKGSGSWLKKRLMGILAVTGYGSI